MINFSREIQGLRAIAVLSVVLFHFGLTGLEGGYLGVDIFFVISGYLIGSIIFQSIDKNQFSIIDFYKNRAVRLFPNLLLMLVVSVIVSWLLLKPYDFFQFGKSLQFSGLYVTNIVFSKQQGYFDISRELKPLLHTWSLSIEEQFYLFLPLFLILIRKISLGKKLLIIGCVVMASFLYKVWLIHTLPINSFFSFPGRVWELGLGVFLAHLSPAIKEKLRGQSTIASIALVTIFIYLIVLEETVPFAGVISIGCCIASGLLILTSPDTWVGRLLSKPFMVYVGTISYSLYLWHWLVLITFKNSGLQVGSLTEFLLMTIISFGISHLAWKYVESSLRVRRNQFSRAQVFTCIFLFTSLTAAAGGYIYAKNGFPERFPKHTKVSENIKSFNWKDATGFAPTNSNECSMHKNSTIQIDKCIAGSISSSKSVLVIGDSHAASIRTAFDIAGQQSNVKVITAVGPGCPPLLGIKSFNGADDICEKIDFNKNLELLLNSHKFTQVYLVAYWDMYARGSRSNGRLLRPTHFISDDSITSNNSETSQARMYTALQRTIQHINQRGVEVVLVQDVPTLPSSIQDLPDQFTQTIIEVKPQSQFIESFLKNQRNSRLKAVDLTKALCHNEICHTYLNGYYLYTDNNHLSPAGSALTIPLIYQSLKN